MEVFSASFKKCFLMEVFWGVVPSLSWKYMEVWKVIIIVIVMIMEVYEGSIWWKNSMMEVYGGMEGLPPLFFHQPDLACQLATTKVIFGPSSSS